MKAFWKIPKEWVQDWGLSWSEAGVLADMVSYPDATREERATRVGMTKPGLIKVLKRLQESKQSLLLLGKQSLLCDGKQSLPSGVNKVYQKRSTKFTKNGKQSLPPPTPPYIEDQEKNIEDIGLTIVSPAETSSAPEKKSQQKKEKKYTPEESKLHGELKRIFDDEWKAVHVDDFYWGAAEMSAIVKIKEQIRFKMKSQGDNPDDTEQIKTNFQFFIHKILTSCDGWTRENASPKLIASKFNEIYTQLKNGNASTNAGGKHDSRPSMVERTLNKYAAMYGSGQQDGGIGSQR